MTRDGLALALGLERARRRRLGDQAVAWVVNADCQRDLATGVASIKRITATRVSSVAAGGRPCYSNQGEAMTPTPRSNPGQPELEAVLDVQEILTGRDEGRPTDADLIEFARREPPKGSWSLEIWHGSITPELLRLLADRLEYSNRMVAAGRRAYARAIAERGGPQ